jgi:hypothetical protein
MALDLKTSNRCKHYAPLNDNYQCNYLKLKVHKKYLVCEVTDRQTDRQTIKLTYKWLCVTDGQTCI